MMRGWRPLFVLAVVGCCARVEAQEMIEVPTPPPAPPAPAVVAAPLSPVPRLWLAVDAGPGYIAAFGSDFAGASVGIIAGGQTRRLSIGGRLRGDFGAVGGLSYENVSVGPQLSFRLSPRARLGGGLSVGLLEYQRASITHYQDPTVWAPTIGADASFTFDLVRTRRGGGMYVLARAGFDWIDNTARDRLDAGMSGTVGAGLGYRY